MSVNVKLDQNNIYTVIFEGEEIAQIPATYLLGRTSKIVDQAEITKAFSDAFQNHTILKQSNRECRDKAYARLGLIS